MRISVGAVGAHEAPHRLGEREAVPDDRDGLHAVVLVDLTSAVDVEERRVLVEGLDVGAVRLGVGHGLGELLLDGRTGQGDLVDGGVATIIADHRSHAERLLDREGPEDDPADQGLEVGAHRVVCSSTCRGRELRYISIKYKNSQ